MALALVVSGFRKDPKARVVSELNLVASLIKTEDRVESDDPDLDNPENLTLGPQK